MQKLFTAAQIKAWDAFTITHEPISSFNLMERAANAFVTWFVKNYTPKRQIHIFCGPGNNGGDGLAIGRLLLEKGYHVAAYISYPKNKLSADCKANFKRLQQVNSIKNTDDIKQLIFQKNDIIIDALFGSGLSRNLAGIFKDLVLHLNSQQGIKITVDIPSGMYCDTINKPSDTIFKSDIIISFQIPKRAFYFIENNTYINSVICLAINLSEYYYEATTCKWFVINSLSAIKNFNNLPKKIYNLDSFANHFGVPFTSINGIALLQKNAKYEQQIMHLSASSFYIITPNKNVYLLFS